MPRHRFRHILQRAAGLKSPQEAFAALPIACFAGCSPSNVLAQLELYRWAHEQANHAAQAALDDFWLNHAEN